MDKQALADITVFNKYAKFLAAIGRRENWSEISDRNRDMQQLKYPALSEIIHKIYANFVTTKRALPSMRSMQFGGKPILMAENRMFNCAYAPIEMAKFYSELMFLLLGGTGMGYSVQRHHINQLPKIKVPESDQEYKFQIQDSIIGWADTIKVVCKSFFNAGTLPIFDYRDIREKGTDLITSGGKAPGPDPLILCVNNILAVLRRAIGRKLTSIETHDLACYIADAVRAGGIRRAAMICLFDRDDAAMLHAKEDQISGLDFKVTGFDPVSKLIQWTNVYGITGSAILSKYDCDHFEATGKLSWRHVYPARARANNSAVLPRGEVTLAEFQALMKVVEASGCGEPGVYWTNDKDWGTNPCCEIALRPYQMCNLTTINAGAVTDQASFNAAAGAAAFIGTLQAGYTDFHYLNPKWKQACEKEALLGVSMTNIASGTLRHLDMREAARVVMDVNAEIAAIIGINPAARGTCLKPEGTASLVVGGASGIHDWHGFYYIRRTRHGRDEAIVQYMLRVASALVEIDETDPKQVVLSFPQKAPASAMVRSDSTMLSLLERVRQVSRDWVSTGHRSGANQHNVSCTISVKDDEWAELTDWMWTHRDSYNGISVMPYYGSTSYPQMPFEEITEAQFNAMLPLLQGIDISQVFELDGSGVDLQAELACAGNVCELAI